MTRAVTGFDPGVHGFRFVNRFVGSQVVSELAAQRRLDQLIGVNLPSPVEAALALLRGTEFWGTFGLCGGMSWAALDRFINGQPPPPDTQPPTQGSVLFTELVKRQADSLSGTELVKRVVTWQLLSDTPRWWRFWVDSLNNLVLQREWPRLRSGLDDGQPQSLCLIRSRGLGGIAANHQVVAIGYQLSAEGRVAVDLYDPNHPTAIPQLTFELGRGTGGVNCRQNTGEPLRGFFVWSHRR